MKIAQLTQPLHINYGGILQAYALQTVLRGMGHNVVNIDRRLKKRYVFSLRLTPLRILSVIKSILRKYLLHEGGIGINNPFREDYNAMPAPLYSNLRAFIDENIIHTEPLFTTKDLTRCMSRHHFDAIIVGSDQVWRQEYSPCITDYFLTFLPCNSKVRRIAYAASVGIDEIDIEEDALPLCAEGIKRFDAVSVREEKARELLQKVFGVDSMVLLDPTMLLTQSEWGQLFSSDESKEAKVLACYVLDENNAKKQVVDDVGKTLQFGKTELTMLPKASSGQPLELDSISTWLSTMANAEFVVTDSFHGCVFSIIFNKPFIAIANSDRGLSRFQTLLGHFNLQHRLIFSFEEYVKYKDDLLQPIDYEPVNKIIEKLRIRSRQFLENVLS